MTEGAKAISISGAVIAPAALSALFVQLCYVFEWKAEWPQIAVVSIAHVGALIVLFRLLDWRWWMKAIAAIPYIALSLAATAYICLIIAAAHGNAL